jgi:hypothetical protein
MREYYAGNLKHGSTGKVVTDAKVAQGISGAVSRRKCRNKG